MKKILFLMAMLPMMLFTACSSDDEEDTKVEATKQSVQGSWASTHYDNFYNITFSEDEYSFILMDIESKKITKRENGIYSIDGTKIHTKEGSFINNDEIYFTDESRIYLHISSMGDCLKSK